MSAATTNLLETLNIVAPLGLRFWDEVSQTTVGEGLSVYAYPADNPQWRTLAFSNHGSVYTFRDLPGLRKAESGSGDADFWLKNRPSFPFVVEVNDLYRRFQPFSFRIHLPVQRVWEWNCEQFGSPSLGFPVTSSPPETRPAGIPLFPSAERNVPAGMAVVRAFIQEAIDPHGRVAAGAMLLVSIANKLVARGIADQKGRVVVIFAYPDPPEFSPGSPATKQRSLRDLSWELEINAFYMRKDPILKFPNLCDLLNQPPAVLWEDAAHTTPLSSRTLRYGEELTLRSGTGSALLISVAGSPQ